MKLGHWAQLTFLTRFGSFILLILLAGCSQKMHDLPVAEKHPVITDWHGELRTDNYLYMADADHPATQDYIRAERSYSEEIFQEWRSLRREIHSELNQLLPEATGTPAVQLGDFLYWREVVPGAQYPIFYRRALSVERPRETVLDTNLLARSSAYYSLGDFSVSPDGQRVAFTEDSTGEQDYRLRIMEIASGRELDAVEGLGLA